MATTPSSGSSGLLRIRAVRHVLLTTAVALAVCAVVAVLSWRSGTQARAELDPLTGRAVGEVVAVDRNIVRVRWTPPGGEQREVEVPLAVSPPPVGTRAEVAYDPARPEHAIVPGAELIAQVDRAASGVVFPALVAVVLLGTVGWQLVSRARAARRPVRTAVVRRVRVQSGLLARSWLELEKTPQRWIPVHFDPVLVTLPAPTRVRLHGDPLHDRLVAVEADGVLLYPSGPVRASEPRGRRTDFPSRPDDEAPARARAAGALTRQLRTDVAFVVPAPLVGLFWAYLDGGGFPVWIAATAMAAALGLWWPAVRGSDPT